MLIDEYLTWLETIVTTPGALPSERVAEDFAGDINDFLDHADGLTCYALGGAFCKQVLAINQHQGKVRDQLQSDLPYFPDHPVWLEVPAPFLLKADDDPDSDFVPHAAGIFLFTHGDSQLLGIYVQSTEPSTSVGHFNPPSAFLFLNDTRVEDGELVMRLAPSHLGDALLDPRVVGTQAAAESARDTMDLAIPVALFALQAMRTISSSADTGACKITTDGIPDYTGTIPLAFTKRARVDAPEMTSTAVN